MNSYDSPKQYFGLIDYIVFASVLGISAGIGLYYRFSGGRQKTFKEYLLADQKMSIIPVAFSLMASFMSAITILGVSKEIYIYGMQFFVINISYIISTPIVCYLYLPVFYRLQKMSVYEYLEMRFGKVTRLSASFAFSLQMILYMGIVLFAPALALAAVTGISQTWSIVAVGLVCTFYSSVGGMKAVLITDVFQSLLMFAAVFAVIIQGVSDFGFTKIIDYAREGDRLEFFNTSLDPRVRHTVFSLGIGGIFTYCSLYGVNQAQVQRLLTVRSLKKSQQSLWLQWVILLCLSCSTCFAGLVLYAQYRNCDPKENNIITNTDQMLPLYVVQNLGRIEGISGLFVSGIFSGSLSTVSSALNSLSAVTLHDYLMPLFPSLVQDENKASTLSKLVSVGYGFLCMGLAFAAQYLGTGVLQASLTIFGAVGGPLLALFTLGMLCRWINQKGAVCGLYAGLILTLWIGFGQPKPHAPIKPLSIEGCKNVSGPFNSSASIYFIDAVVTSTQKTNILSFSTNSTVPIVPQVKDSNFVHELYAISYMWVATIGFLSTFIVANVVSVFTKSCPSRVDQNLLSQFVWNKEDKIRQENLNHSKSFDAQTDVDQIKLDDYEKCSRL